MLLAGVDYCFCSCDDFYNVILKRHGAVYDLKKKSKEAGSRKEEYISPEPFAVLDHL